jgi:VanZ family protein
LPVVIWALVIFSFSAHPSISTSEIKWQDFIVKKAAHMTEYAILAILLFRALKKSGLQRIEKIEGGFLVVLLIFFYGATDEFHQSLVPGRDPTVRDAIIDAAGGLLGVYIILKLLPKAPEKIKRLAKKLDLL